MLNIKGKALSVLYASKLKFSAAKLRLGKKLGLIQSVMIMPYQGFGNKQELYFPGRVLRDRGIGISRLEDSKWKNFSKMYKRFMTWEIPFVRVKATLDKNISETTVTDEEGYFTFHLVIGNDIRLNMPWHNILLTLEDEIVKNRENVQAESRVYITSDDSEYGIISDIDDTIVPTGSTRIREMLKTTFFHNAHSRVPFPGVAAFYKALAKGSKGFGNNPVFYISSSPWNLYDFLLEFMRVHNIPQGPLMLRDIGPSKEYLIAGSHTAHKLLQVERIFKIISDIPFILIGDSGQHDAEIYLQVIKDFPGRIKMIYIRNVSSMSHDKVLKISGETKKFGVEMLLVKSTLEAARHAYSQGWITESAVGRVAGEKVADEAES